MYHVTKAGVIEDGSELRRGPAWRATQQLATLVQADHKDVQLAIDDPSMDLATLAMPRLQRTIEATGIACTIWVEFVQGHPELTLPTELRLAESIRAKLYSVDTRVKGKSKHWVGEICRILRSMVADVEVARSHQHPFPSSLFHPSFGEDMSLRRVRAIIRQTVHLLRAYYEMCNLPEPCLNDDYDLFRRFAALLGAGAQLAVFHGSLPVHTSHPANWAAVDAAMQNEEETSGRVAPPRLSKRPIQTEPGPSAVHSATTPSSSTGLMATPLPEAPDTASLNARRMPEPLIQLGRAPGPEGLIPLSYEDPLDVHIGIMASTFNLPTRVFHSYKEYLDLLKGSLHGKQTIFSYRIRGHAYLERMLKLYYLTAAQYEYLSEALNKALTDIIRTQSRQQETWPPLTIASKEAYLQSLTQEYGYSELTRLAMDELLTLFVGRQLPWPMEVPPPSTVLSLYCGRPSAFRDQDPAQLAASVVSMTLDARNFCSAIDQPTPYINMKGVPDRPTKIAQLHLYVLIMRTHPLVTPANADRIYDFMMKMLHFMDADPSRHHQLTLPPVRTLPTAEWMERTIATALNWPRSNPTAAELLRDIESMSNAMLTVPPGLEEVTGPLRSKRYLHSLIYAGSYSTKSLKLRASS